MRVTKPRLSSRASRFEQRRLALRCRPRASRATPAPLTLRIRIDAPRHDAAHAGREQRIGARRRAAVMACRARASRRPSRRARARPPRASASDFGVRLARTLRASLRRRSRSSRASTQPTRGFGSRACTGPRSRELERARASRRRSNALNTHCAPCRSSRRDSAGSSDELALARRLARGAMSQALDLLAERVDVLEAAVDRGEAHVGDFVELVQLLHHDLADLPRRHFALAERCAACGRCARRRPRSPRSTTGRFSSALMHAAAQLALVERLARCVALDDARHDQLGGLERGEALAAGQALAAPADLRALARQARVDDLGVVVRAERAMHGRRRYRRASRP